MENRDKQNETGQQSDISKSQSAQQPTGQAQASETGQDRASEGGQSQESFGQQGDQSNFDQSTGQSDQSSQSSQPGYGSSDQGDTLSQQRTDVEGASQARETGEAESGFVGSEGGSDTSSELIEDEDLAKDGQGAPEGK